MRSRGLLHHEAPTPIAQKAQPATDRKPRKTAQAVSRSSKKLRRRARKIVSRKHRSPASPRRRGRHPWTTESRRAAVSLRQDGLDYFDTHHTADDTLDKIDPKQLDQAVAVWSAFTYLAAASDVDFRSLAPTAK
jgi:hypothetical protein